MGKSNKYNCWRQYAFIKRPDNFLPLKWPSYFNKAKGCYVWDLNNKKYIDLCMMGVGTSLLGYANSKIDKAVKKRIDNGIVSTLNSKEDITLAEMLIKLDPWSDMVKFARSGGEALAISIRLARSYSKKLKSYFADITDGMIGIYQQMSGIIKD